MSLEIDWASLTTGPDGLALAETIREFIHDRFQQIALPRFISSVEVHSFEFGDEGPEIELKDVCDPLPDFYEDDDEDEDKDDDDPRHGGSPEKHHDEGLAIGVAGAEPRGSLQERRQSSHRPPEPPVASRTLSNLHMPRLRSNLGLVDQIASPLLSRSSTPGIPGGTSNRSYFHLPLSAGLSGTQTPLVAVAGGTPYPYAHSTSRAEDHQSSWLQHSLPPPSPAYGDPSTRPSTAYSHPRSRATSQTFPSRPSTPPRRPRRLEPDPNDVQVVLHISYCSNVRLALTARILLDYPMPSFVSIPLNLTVTGVGFDGTAVLAYLRKRAHFCFLGLEDARSLVGVEGARAREGRPPEGLGDGSPGDLLREIKIESEIGQRVEGKQVLKNVGKVERFVLEQVRRIFEEELVFPSFWTFLV